MNLHGKTGKVYLPKTGAPKENSEYVPEQVDYGKGAKTGKGGKEGKEIIDGPCKHACTPKIDVRASVIEAYKRHRAQVAVLGDYGSCTGAKSSNEYTWTVDWGDSQVHNRGLDHVGPYQSVHTYAKKGKYEIEVTFCAVTKGCDSGCTTISKSLKVKP
jgi:hypothetical protein